MSSSAPVLFLIFSRPDTTARVFEAIRKARPARLYVAADGPRAGRPKEAERCEEARRVVSQVDWPCEVKTLFRERNLGCRRAVSGAISWFFEHEQEGIILEDDCLPDPSFFTFCTALLERYRDNPRVMCITGNNFQADMQAWPFSYYYSIFNHCWGWASWRRAWDLYDSELKNFDLDRSLRELDQLSRVQGFGAHWKQILDRVKNGKIDSWAYIWTWSCFREGGLTCTPRTNLVSNIGFGPEATHTVGEGSPLANLPVAPLPSPFTSPHHLAAEPRFDDHVARAVFRVASHTSTEKAVKRLRHIVGRTLRSLGLR
ncbi:hypothetical protein HKCCSP123_11425 [Rhodobacterales bacterium HKCCSP123]|nr:hypothetical protein [Rhodobacterales bacterium HKCCSP123]